MLSLIRYQSRILLKGVDSLSKYYSIHEFSKIIGVSAQTLRNWDANGKLHPHHTTVSGYRYYSDEQLNQVINVKPKNRITIGYCRVSSHKQKDDLERQIDNAKTLRIWFKQSQYSVVNYKGNERIKLRNLSGN